MSNIPFVGLAVLWSLAAAAADVDDEVEAVDDADEILFVVDWILDPSRGVSTTLDDPTPF